MIIRMRLRAGAAIPGHLCPVRCHHQPLKLEAAEGHNPVAGRVRDLHAPFQMPNAQLSDTNRVPSHRRTCTEPRKYELPDRFFGIGSSTSPTLVSHARAR